MLFLISVFFTFLVIALGHTSLELLRRDKSIKHNEACGLVTFPSYKFDYHSHIALLIAN